MATRSVLALSILSACGSKSGTGGTDPSAPNSDAASGSVIDGYVSGARVFRDANGNNRFDLGEKFALTNESGFFSGLAGLRTVTLVVDDNSGTAIDTATGFPLALTMSAPGDYVVITPVTTLIVGLEAAGMTRSEAEGAVKSVLNLPSSIHLATFDPFAGGAPNLSSGANDYQVAAIKIANVLMASDGDFSTNSLAAYEEAVANLVAKIRDLDASGQKISFDDVSTLTQILPNVSSATINELRDANAFTEYLEVLDGQLSFLSANADGSIVSDTETGYTLVKVELTEGLSFEGGQNFLVTLTNSATGVSVTSVDLVSSGARVAIFRFQDSDLRSMGDGSIGVVLKNQATGEILSTSTSFDLEISAPVDRPPVTDTGSSTSGSTTPTVQAPETSSGTVIDGYIEGARVFRDMNLNSRWDSGEPFVITGPLGAFSGLGGDTSVPITVDSNDGNATDVGDGSADAVPTPFTGLLSAPAGSTVITPITTVINEIMLADPTVTVATANTRVATMLKLDVNEVGDLTKFKFKLDGTDAVSNKVFTKTAFVGSAILGTAKEKGGDGATQAANARLVAQKFADLADSAATLDFEESALTSLLIEVTGLGEGSSLVQRTKTNFKSAPGQNDVELNPVQISTAARSVFDEFNDDFLTSLEASDGAELTVGSADTSAMSGVHTAKIYNADNVLLKTFTGTGSKFAAVKLTAEELIGDASQVPAGYVNVEVKKGNLASVQAFDAVAETVFSEVKSFFFYKGLYPSVSIGQAKIVADVSGGQVRINGTSSDFSMTGTVTVDLTSIGLPNTYSIEKMFQFDDGSARKVTVQFIDGSGKVQYALAAPLASFTKVSATKGTYTWTLNNADFSTNYGSVSPKNFANLSDGTYSVVASFTDALGASNLGDESASARSKDTFAKLIIDKAVPTVSNIKATSGEVAIGQSIEFTVTVSEPIASIDASKITFEGLNTSGGALTPIQVTSGMISHVAGASKFTVTYTPTGEGRDLKLKLGAGAVKDASGNPNAGAIATDGVDFDMVAPSFAVGAVKINNGAVSVVTGEYGANELELSIQASENLGALASSNVRIVSTSGRTLFDNLQLTPAGTSSIYTSKLNLKSSAIGADDTFRVVVSGARDAFGNLGAQFTSGIFTLDANAPSPYSVELINSRQTYGKDQKVDIKVKFDDDVSLDPDGSGNIYIPLSFNGVTVNAVLDASHPDLDPDDDSFVIFSYTVGNTDRTAGSIISVGNSIISDGTARLEDANGNLASYDLSAAVIKLLNLGGRSIDGGSAGASLDGYIDGAIIYSDLTNNGLTSDDPIAQADATGSFTIYGADGPLVMEGGFDISTNKDFNVRYKAPSEASIINPVTTLIVSAKGDADTSYPIEVVYQALGSPLGAGNHLQLLTYNSYAAIGSTVDLSVMTGAGSVQSTVDEALAFQKLAASFALVADFMSTSLHHSGTTAGTSIADVSNKVFANLAAGIEGLVTKINAVDTSTHLSNFYNGLDLDVSFTALSNQLETLLSSIDGAAALKSKFPDLYDLLATSIIAIKNADTDFDYVNNPTDFLGASEAGINALTEIVQVQKVVQTNMLNDLALHFQDSEITDWVEAYSSWVTANQAWVDAGADLQNQPAALPTVDVLAAASKYGTWLEQYSAWGTQYGAWLNDGADPAQMPAPLAPPLPDTVSVAGLLGSADLKTYLQEPVGTVVPIRYSIGLKEGADAVAFEGAGDGTPKTFEFTITRSGSIKTQSTLEYRISGDVSAADLATGDLSGQVFFDVNVKSIDLAIELLNDDIREGIENLIVEIFDPTATSQITNSRVSVEVLDDDPSRPQLSTSRVVYDLTEGASANLDPIAVEYFDARAYFSLNASVSDGVLKVKNSAVAAADNAYQTAFTFKTDTLRNISYTAEGLDTDTVSASAILSITTAETYADATPGGRQAEEQLELVFNVHRTPVFDAGSVTLSPIEGPAISGATIAIQGISIGDVDSDTVSVSITNANSEMSGVFSTTSIAPVSRIVSADGSLTLSGSITDVQDALAFLQYSPSTAGDLKVSLRADDGDTLHIRDAQGELTSTSVNSRMSLDLGTLNMSGEVLSGLTSVGTTAAGEAMYVLSKATHGVRVDNGNYVLTGSDDEGWSAYLVSGAGTDQDPYVRGSQVDATTSLTVAAAPPEFIQSYVPNIKIGDTVWSKFSGVKVSDVDSDSLTLTVQSLGANADFRFVDNSVPGTTTYSTNPVLTGTPDEISAQLENLELQLRSDETGLIQFEMTDGETTAVTLTPIYVPTLNAIPYPGGNISSATSITEDALSPTQTLVTVAGILLKDDDENSQPTQIKLISSTGGTPVDGAGTRLIPLDGSEVLLTVNEGSVSFNFRPDKDFSGTAEVAYVVVDAEIPSATSAPSTISIPVSAQNDAPVLSSSGQASTFVEGGQPLSFLKDVNITDVDSTKISKISLSAQLLAGDEILVPDLFGFRKDAAASSSSKIVISGDTSISLKNARDYLANIKFTSSSDNYVGRPELKVLVSVTDSEGASATDISQSIRFVDVNDAPSFTWAGPSVVEITENSAEGFVIGTAGAVSDPENNVISEVRVSVVSGYQIGVDLLSVNSSYVMPSGVSASFDAASGTLSLISQAGAGLKSADFNGILKNVKYTNSNENPLIAKTLIVTVKDEQGAVGVSTSQALQIRAENDAPKIYSPTTGLSTGSGEAFVEGGTPARLAPSAIIEDVDNGQFKGLTISSPGIGELVLSDAGKLLATANGLAFSSGASGYTLSSVSEGALTSKSVLQSLLREISFTTDASYSSDPTAPSEIVFSITVEDPAGATGTFTSSVALLDAPAVQVKKDLVTVNTQFGLSATSAPKDSQVVAADPTFANFVIFNTSFYARELYFDLETSTIRTEVGRFVYDRALNTLDLNRAGHIDLSKVSGVDASVSDTGTTTAIYGQAPKAAVSALSDLSYSDIIIGSQFDDFIDGRGGYDLIQGGLGNDKILFRASSADKGSIYDGNGGEAEGVSDSDTLLLPANFAGGLVSLTALENPLNDVIVRNFENLDASPVTVSVELIGNSVANILTGGVAADIIHLGVGGDTAAGGAGEDVFVIDVGAIPTVGTSISDFSRLDKIKLTDGGSVYKIDKWSAGASLANVSSNGLVDAWITQSAGRYIISIEAGVDGPVKSIDIGDRAYGTLAKWLSTDGDGYSVIKPVLNAPTSLVNKGLVTSPSQTFELAKFEAEGVVSYSLDISKFAASDIPSFGDADGDTLTATFSLTLEAGIPDGAVVFDSDAYGLPIVGNSSAINAAIAALKLTASQMASGVLKISVTDGYSSVPAVKQIYFEAPNTAPELTFTLAEGAATGLTVSEEFILQKATLEFSDQDLSDRSGGLKLIVEVEGGTLIPPADFSEYLTETSAGYIAQLGIGDVAPTDWVATLETILASTGVTRTDVGTAIVRVQLEDAEGLRSSEGEVSIKFAPNAPPAPKLFVFGKAAVDKTVLNAAEFASASVRVSMNDLGARVGDKLNFYAKGEGGSYDVLKGSVTLKASQLDASKVQPVVEIALSSLFPAAVTGAYEILPVLVAAGFDPISNGESAYSVSLDATAPDAPVVTGVNGVVEGLLSNVSQVAAISIAEPSEPGLTYSFVKVNASGVPWYDFASIKEGSVVDPTTGKLRNALTLTVDSEDPTILKFGAVLLDGLYAVFATDAVGNLSKFKKPSSINDESVFNFFAIDSAIDVSGLGIDALIDNIEARKAIGNGLYNYVLNKSIASDLTLSLGSTLQLDVIQITVDVWDGQQTFAADGSTLVEPKITETFEREFGSSTWSELGLSDYVGIASLTSASEFKVQANIFGGLGAREDLSEVSVRVTLRDAAGNETALSSRPGQFALDFTADDGEAIVLGAAPKLFTGISIEELEGSSVFSALNVDGDYSRVSTLYITASELRKALGATETTGAIVFDAANSDDLPSFLIDGVSYSLDVQSLVFPTLTDAQGDPPPANLSVDGLVWVDEITTETGSSGVYVRSEDFKDYKSGQSVATYTTSLPIVLNALDPQDMTVTVKAFAQILDPVRPAEDDYLFSITKVTDTAGNVSFASGFRTGDKDLDALRIDVTDPYEPVLKVERAELVDGVFKLDHWDVLNAYAGEQGVRFTLKTITEGDVISGVTVNGTIATIIDVDQGLYFIQKNALLDDAGSSTQNTISFGVTEVSGNVATFEQSFVYDADQPEAQALAVVASQNGSDVVFDVYLSDDVVASTQDGSFEGTSIDLKFYLPVVPSSDVVTFASHAKFSRPQPSGPLVDLGPEFNFDHETGTVTWSGISSEELLSVPGPILSIVYNNSNDAIDLASQSLKFDFSNMSGKTSFVRVNDQLIDYAIELNKLEYFVDMTQLILTPDTLPT